MPPPKTPLPPNPPSPPLPKPNSWVFDHSEEKEYNRQLRQHYVMKQVLGGKTNVSLDQAEQILDVGCGIGLWVWEASQQYADTEVIGMDIHVPDMQSGPWAKHIVGRLRTSASNNSTSSFASSLNGKDRQVPGHNISFMYADFLKPFPYDDASFDFVHAQDISWYVPMQDWPALISQFHRIIKPNGLLQVIEHDGIFKSPGPALVLINEWHQLVAKENGVDLSYCPGGLETELRRAGMDVLETQTLDIPIGEWPNELVQKQHGFLYKEQIKTKFRSVQRWWLTAAGISSQQYDKICMEAMDEFDQYQTSVTWTITVARKKPLDWAGSNNTQ
ncbi:S-adenosyl-L-methionine-dependent methyltransferase [Gongronella butleri]|nr:S-adenosyl-L-methionine-dependent methyltransferase [Gongronella butleri]